MTKTFVRTEEGEEGQGEWKLGPSGSSRGHKTHVNRTGGGETNAQEIRFNSA